MPLDTANPLPPQNLEAEQSFLGAVLLDKDALLKVADKLVPEDFYKDAHSYVYEAMLELYEKHEPIDLLSLTNRLQEKGRLELIGGRSYLVSLAQAVPTSSHVVHYSTIIQKKATLRRLQIAAADITGSVFSAEDEIESILDRAEQKIFAVSQKLLRRVFVPLKDVLSEAFERIDELHREKGKLRGLTTGFTELDNLLAGLQKSDLIIIAARPSVGKTSFALDLARQVSTNGKASVGIFSLEMSKEQLVDRLICSQAGIDLWKMRTGKLSDAPGSDDFSRIGHAMNELSEAKIFIDDTANANIMEIRTKARRLQSEHGLDAIILDYLQLMEGTSKQDGRVQEIAEITRGLKSIARELNVPVVALSQLSRAVEMTKPALPKLSHLRESGCLTGDSLIVHALTGQRIRMDELAARKTKKPIPVFTLDDDWKLVVRPMSKVFSSGKKKVFELRMKSGKILKASANHPFRKLNGWHQLGTLSVGDALALPRSLCIENPVDRLTEDECVFLAHMIGDGCMVPRQPIHYTSADRINITAVADAAQRLFSITPRLVRQENWWHLYLPSPYRLARGKRHPVTEWLLKHGLQLAHSYDKVLPTSLFECSPNRIALFLKHLWATDGNISWNRHPGRKDSGAIYYASTSLVLIEQIQHLLLRLGIQSTVRKTQKIGYRPSHQLHIQGSMHQLLFLERIGCWGSRGEIIPELHRALKTIHANPNNDCIPAYAWNTVVVSAKNSASMSWRDVASSLGMSYCGSTLFASGISRSRMERLARVCEADELAHLAQSDVLWDTIASITPLGVQDVYDATVPGTHNFIANDIIVHNSIEQDADVVLFIYRKAADRNYRYDELAEDEKHIAEIIIAKHRNGPTGTVKLFWDEKRVSFKNLDRSHATSAIFNTPF
ncbi:MAG: replicative DNA helicase [Patescibacteria group bacterium]